jgi:serine/threonine protein kinase
MLCLSAPIDSNSSSQANVLVSHDGKPKLTDFGLTIMNESKLKLSETDASIGTLRWMVRTFIVIYTSP